MKNIAITVYLTWGAVTMGHLLSEICFIVTRGFQDLETCRRWWCPDGIKNRLKGIR